MTRAAPLLAVLVCCAGCSGEGGAATPGTDVGADASSIDAAVDTPSMDGAVDSADAAAAEVGCKLVDSGPIIATADGQVIEDLHIVATGVPGIKVDGKKNVVIRNVWIEHEGAAGIALVNADALRIEGVFVDHTGAPPSGKNDSAERNNIDCHGSSNVVVRGARLRRGSSGIYLNLCADSQLTQIEGYDFRGPFPRGQLVQFNASHDGVLDGFSVVNGHTSWPEDNVNVYKSFRVVVRNGFIDGNNAPSGVGVIFDGDTGSGTVEDVDAIHMGNGCFSNFAGADGNTFRRVRCRDNICTSQDGRGAPSSNALMFCGKPSGTANTRLEGAKYFASCNGNLTWPNESFSPRELVKEDFTPRAAVRVALCWE
ncbi:MAG: right-handed parallel beta-helix repeat-containing protein [Deltaproteobacteria bacterium]|nr:right-handed parallel beta-helix repeat-containing protein [Deltaproteobacteria bacterium]